VKRQLWYSKLHLCEKLWSHNINKCLQSFDVMEGAVEHGPWRLCWWTPKHIGDIINMWVSIQKRGAQVGQWRILTLLLITAAIIIWVKRQTNWWVKKNWPLYHTCMHSPYDIVNIGDVLIFFFVICNLFFTFQRSIIGNKTFGYRTSHNTTCNSYIT
jgi:hypothetical protein